jgi:hypothetical protein
MRNLSADLRPHVDGGDLVLAEHLCGGLVANLRVCAVDLLSHTP